MLQKRWKLIDTNPKLYETLCQQIPNQSIVCKLLANRLLPDFDAASSFFNPALSQLHDPFLMKDMHKAVLRVQKAIAEGEKMMVFGDYDVDGTSAVATLYQFLAPLVAENPDSWLCYYIPHRFREGYGISKAGIDEAAGQGVRLIISVDCGIKSADLVQYAARLGIEFIICDHHLPDEVLPAATAILNPKQSDCHYPYEHLCGCGIVFKFIQALATQYKLSDSSWLRYLDLQAVAIAADIVPVTGENRVLAHFGLKQINEKPCAGLAALLKLAIAPPQIVLNNLVFLVAPRINAAGRMDDGKLAVQLLIEQDAEKAMALAEELHENNRLRKEADKTTSAEALAMIDECAILQQRHSTVVYHQSWHKGVVGIVASRLIDSYYRPTVVLASSGDLVSGSARSVPGFNLYEAVHACRDHLIGYGGHFAAAGLTMHPEKIDDFRNAFEKYVQQNLAPEQSVPEIIIDADLPFRQATVRFYKTLERMEPYGPGNMRPVFIARRVKETGYSKTVGQRQDSQASTHLKIVLEQDGLQMSGIGFGMGHRLQELIIGQHYDLVYSLDLNEYRGKVDVQLRLIDFRPHIVD